MHEWKHGLSNGERSETKWMIPVDQEISGGQGKSFSSIEMQETPPAQYIKGAFH